MARNAYKLRSEFNTPFKLLIPTVEVIKGKAVKTYPNVDNIPDEEMFFGSFKSYGGTETVNNEVLTIIDTAIVITWFDPRIDNMCRLVKMDDMKVYEVINEPENINKMNQHLRIKIKRLKTGS